MERTLVEKVRDSLQLNNMLILHEDSTIVNPIPLRPFIQHVGFWCAPEEPLYIADDLNKRLFAILQNIGAIEDTEINSHPFESIIDIYKKHYNPAYFLKLGWTIFEQKVGEMKKLVKEGITIQDQEILADLDASTKKKGGFLYSDVSETKTDLKRKITLYMFPNQSLISLAREDKKAGKEYDPETERHCRWYYVHLKDMEESEPNILKILGKKEKEKHRLQMYLRKQGHEWTEIKPAVKETQRLYSHNL